MTHFPRGRVIAAEAGLGGIVSGAAAIGTGATAAGIGTGAAGLLVLIGVLAPVRLPARARPVPSGGEPRVAGLGALTAVVPGVRVAECPVRGQAPAGVLADGHGFAVVLELDPGTAQRLDLGAVAGLLAEDPARPCAVQVLVEQFRIPYPGEGFEPAAAYWKLPDTSAPLARRTFVAVRHEPLRAPDAVIARGGGDTGARKAVGSAAVRLRQELSRRNIRAAVLTRGALHRLLGDLGDRAQHGELRPSAWITPDAAHCTLRGTLGAPGAWSRLIEAAAATPADRSVVSIALDLGAGTVTATAAVRVISAEHARSAAARTALLGAKLAKPMDGAQAEGLVATLPFGGTALNLVDALGVRR